MNKKSAPPTPEPVDQWARPEAIRARLDSAIRILEDARVTLTPDTVRFPKVREASAKLKQIQATLQREHDAIPAPPPGTLRVKAPIPRDLDFKS